MNFLAAETQTNVVPTATPSAWLIGVLVAAIFATWLLIRFDARPLSAVQRSAVAALRTTALLVIAWMWWGWEQVESISTPTEIAIVCDVSQSMSLDDLLNDEVRFAAMMKSVLEKVEGNSSAEQHLVLYSTAGDGPIRGQAAEVAAQLKNWQPTAAKSPIGDALLQVARAQRGRSTAAVILLSDGNVTEGISLATAAEELRSQRVPLFVVGVGREEPEFDLQLADVQVERRVFAGDIVRFQVRVAARGGDVSARVKLLREGSEESLAEASVGVNAQSPTTTNLIWQANEPGDYSLRIVAEPIDSPPERFTANNELTRHVTVQPFDLHVLLAWGYPHYEYRYLKALLERELTAEDADAASKPELRVFLQDADPEAATADRVALRSFPSREDLQKFDVVVLGDLQPAGLGQQAALDLKEFVEERGGGLMIVAGDRLGCGAWIDTPLEPLLPFAPDKLPPAASREKVFTEPLRVLPTPLGKTVSFLQLADTAAANEETWQHLPPIFWQASMPKTKLGVMVLADVLPVGRVSRPVGGRDGLESPSYEEASPILTSHYFGAGRVMYQATDETHRWRFRAGDAHFGRYWRQIVRQLGRRKLLHGAEGIELASDREEYKAGETAEFRVRFFNADKAPQDITADLSQNDGPSQSVLLTRDPWEPGLFRGSRQVFAAGEYRWTVPGSREPASFRVSDPPQELAHTALARRELEEAAKIGEGKYSPLEKWNELWAALPAATTNVETGERTPLWNNAWLAAIVVGLLTSEWWLRRKWGWT